MDLERTPLLTDLYELTMLQTYLEHGMTERAVFEFFVRPAGPRRPFFVAAGVEHTLDWLSGMHFEEPELQWIRDSGLFRDGFAEELASLRFTGDVTALPEGTVCFPGEPIVRVSAPLPEAQLVESRLMNIVHFQTLIATKAARCRIAADDRRVVDFGLRRAHGAEAGLWAARACYMAGFDATATVAAGMRYGVPVTGTMAHSFILSHDSETEAFERFAHSHPNNVVLLIDTYDVDTGARQVAKLAPRLREAGIAVRAVRIDSGDLASHARSVRTILDDAGLQETGILVSGGLDEDSIAALVASGAPIDGFGVGSKVDTSADIAFLDSAYKLHEYAGRPRNKRSEGKQDLPGIKQVFRHFDVDGRMAGDIIGLTEEAAAGQPLLETVMRDGRRTGPAGTLDGARARCGEQLGQLPASLRALSTESGYPVTLSPGLNRLRSE